MPCEKTSISAIPQTTVAARLGAISYRRYISTGRGTADIVVRNSAMIDRSHVREPRKCCYTFAAWFEGAFDYVARSEEPPLSFKATEVYCAGEGQHDHCRFEVRPTR